MEITVGKLLMKILLSKTVELTIVRNELKRSKTI